MKTISVTCAIIYFDNKVLAVQRSATMSLPLKWEFPGGKIEPGENEIDCIKREISEELNIDIKIRGKLTPVIHQYPNFKIHLIPFIADYVSGDMTLREHADHLFLNKEELNTLDWAEADLPILNEYTSITF